MPLFPRKCVSGLWPVLFFRWPSHSAWGLGSCPASGGSVPMSSFSSICPFMRSNQKARGTHQAWVCISGYVYTCTHTRVAYFSRESMASSFLMLFPALWTCLRGDVDLAGQGLPAKWKMPEETRVGLCPSPFQFTTCAGPPREPSGGLTEGKEETKGRAGKTGPSVGSKACHALPSQQRDLTAAARDACGTRCLRVKLPSQVFQAASCCFYLIVFYLLVPLPGGPPPFSILDPET